MVANKIVAAALLLAFSANVAVAQERPADHLASKRSTPGDTLPPFNMLDDEGRFTPQSPTLGPPRHTVGEAPEWSEVGPGLQTSLRLVEAGIRACNARHYVVGVVILDVAGHIRAAGTADQADGSHIFVGQRKAITALAFGTASSEALKLYKSGQSKVTVTPAMFLQPGALLIHRGGQVIGAIGISGGHGPTIDEDCGRDAIAAVGGGLTP